MTRRLIHSVPVGFGSGGGLFFALDGLLEALVWVVWSGLVWSGLAVLSSGGGVTTRSVSVCLVVCSFRTVCCIQYSFCLVFARFLVLNLRWETLNYLLAVLIDNN